MFLWGGGVGGWLGVAMLHNFGSRVTRKSCRCCCCFFFIEIMCREPWITRVNPLSPNGDQHQYSPNNIHTMSRD